MANVLIASPSRAMRTGLRAMLGGGPVLVAGEVAALEDVGLVPGPVDALLLTDEALLAEPEAALPLAGWGALALVVLSDDAQLLGTLRRLPLRGWALLPLDTTPEELQAAILAAVQGLAVLSVPIAERLINPHEGGGEEPLEPLTGRESEVLGLLGQGLSNKMIARELDISEHTVKFHVSSIFSKLGASSRTDAVSRGARWGLIVL